MKLTVVILVFSIMFSSCSIKDEKSNISSQENNTIKPVLSQNRDKTVKNKVEKSVLNKNYKAADISGLTNWINSEGYNSLEELKGKVVLIDFWTLGCINCARTLPHVEKLYQKYKDKDFVIIGVHAPEFSYERKLENLKKAVIKHNLSYPIAQDNVFKIWKAYENKYWPAFYLIDKNGNIRYTHFGEGKYEEMDMAVSELTLGNTEQQTSAKK